ncbi:electron transfer flavoprotein subunit alpha [Peptoclostridium acidaminophilum DSM 3953]|uniref:Electron transfer flavoprotein subunit alpha n=1 Tax=Peptoclostridium acidaminophilum DSM 3953 TaxID=1286171 RepID=W8U5B8_PEPAC|nr:electron transfer flavoprotein subunit alpha [Peptoclostridium acidaminophilum]AHM56121.1 electron transfer flavoprotein subunit alpha [Peptoclostridium acidaminophilum DSM 3953]
MAKIIVLEEKCVGCGKCINVCPFNAITLENNKAVIGDACVMCGACERNCPFGAIKIERIQGYEQDISLYKGVWVFAEQRGGETAGVAFELLGAARRLADRLGESVAAVLIGDGVSERARELIAYGADFVYVVEGKEYENFSDELYANACVKLAEEHRPSIFLLGATAYGRSLAPRISSSLETGLTADCTVLDIDEESGMFVQTRPAFGGNIMASIVCPARRPQMATVRPRVMKKPEPDFGRSGSTVMFLPVMAGTPKARLLERIQEEGFGTSLSDAEVIVAAGRGICDSKNLELVEELARLLNGAVGASRPIVDAGWIDHSHQVGQTGRTVAPKLYIAAGISGAVQHVAGMSSSDFIVAINKDKDAPIFKIANIGIVGDSAEIIKELIAQLKSKQAKSAE